MSKKSISITVVSSEHVVEHILPAQIECHSKTKHKKKKGPIGSDLTYSTNLGKTSQQQSSSEDDNEMETELPAPKQDDHDPDYGEVFKFRTHKKSGQMVSKAETCTPKSSAKRGKQGTPKSLKVKAVATPPKTPRLQDKFSHEASTPLKLGVAAQREHKRVESSTPYRLRKRNMDSQHSGSSSDDSVDDDTSSDEAQEEEEEMCTDKKSSTNNDTDMSAKAENYFDLHSMAPITSDRTMSSLDGPRLDVDTIREVLKHFDDGHKKSISELMEKHTRFFKRWMFNMCCGYNILLYGLGSKRLLLDKFREEYLMEFSHLVINGYFPSLTVKHILNSITEEILETSKGFTNVYSQIEFIQEAYKNKNEDFYLVIHNIDGVLLRSEKSQAVLSSLAKIEGFHIIGSVDHINAVLMWDQNKYCHFRWLWYETATFQHYDAENSYENSLMVQQSGSLAMSSLVHVMRSLTPNARQVFLLLAEYQLEMGQTTNYSGMSFQTLYHKCREAFLVNSDLTLQAQLVEFKDHRLILSKKNYEGIEHLIIPVDQATLKEFIQEHKSS
ncbi:origin recognition complex subunit 2-like [Physella acuta]|uniref:origin recognition complex subunit 2-like n=1 Tax=Physella acuta TaxID=109671 RepID=UPI0027DE5398|nr:origin recognition complex subunit 2-like [Physella acuta]